MIAAVIWVFALGCGYIGLIFLFLGGMMGPRGDIDYPDFSEAQRRAADNQAFLTQLFGLVPLALSVLALFFSVRIARFVAGVHSDRDAT